MEEQQIQEFVHRASNDEALREKLVNNPEEVIKNEGFSPLVARVVMRLVPHLTMGVSMKPACGWWC